jgi:hypothetical protein
MADYRAPELGDLLSVETPRSNCRSGLAPTVAEFVKASANKLLTRTRCVK